MLVFSVIKAVGSLIHVWLTNAVLKEIVSWFLHVDQMGFRELAEAQSKWLTYFLYMQKHL